MSKVLIFLALLVACFALQGVVELTDSNFKQLVQSQPKFWLVMFSASWCGHCTHLKPQIEKLSPLLADYGVSVGHVGENNQKLVGDYVVDHTTHMVSYPKLMVFLGQEKMSDVPPGLRSAPQILQWFKNTYSLESNAQL